jgi:RNA polymerase sigma-70 factor, ECF subfamily
VPGGADHDPPTDLALAYLATGGKRRLAAAFEEHRDHLRAVAYRLLGSMTDADDAVQDTWLRLTGVDTSEVENLGGWLTTVVARVSLNMLRSRRYRHEEPVGDSWPGAAEVAARAGAVAGPGGAGTAGRAGDPEDEDVLADSVGLALRPDRAPDLARQREVATAFLAASRGGGLSALVALLDSDVTLTADAVAAPSGKPVLLRGADMVARGALVPGPPHRAPHPVTPEPAWRCRPGTNPITRSAASHRT